MCFSATASFTASAILGIAGFASVKKAEKSNQKLYAAIPLLFSMQQLAEGFVWLSIKESEIPSWKNSALIVFLIFALIIWPLWISISVLIMEKNLIRKLIQVFCLLCGGVFAFSSSLFIFSFPVNAIISNYHILYILDFPHEKDFLTAMLYFVATVIPLLLSGVKHVPVVGVLILASYITTKLLFNDVIISVWCFFAGIVSTIIFMMFSKRIVFLGKKLQ